MQTRVKSGFTLIETMVVLSVFAVLAIMVTAIVLYSIRGTGKSANTYTIRSEMDYAAEIIARQLRNARGITNCSGSSTFIDYTDANGKPARFICDTGNNYIASGSADLSVSSMAKLSSSKIDIQTCSFTCTTSTTTMGIPESVTFRLSGIAKDQLGVQGAEVSIENNIMLRNY